MKTNDLKNSSTQDLAERYEALLRQQFTIRDYYGPDGRKDNGPWNRIADQIEATHRELTLHGDAGVDAILPLINHPNPNVRYSAIVDCLRQRTSKALPALEAMAATNDWRETNVDPKRALEMCREGKWVVD